MVHPLLDQDRHTLLGRLRTKAFSQITGSTDRLPTQKQLWSFLMPEWKRNPLVASLYFLRTLDGLLCGQNVDGILSMGG
jgi:hypothetical protein